MPYIKLTFFLLFCMAGRMQETWTHILICYFAEQNLSNWKKAKLRALYLVPCIYYDLVTGHQSVSFELLSFIELFQMPWNLNINIEDLRWCRLSKHWLLQRCHLCHEYAITDDEAGQSSEKLCNQQSLMSNQHFYHWWELNRITKSQLLNFAYIGEITYFARTRLLFLVVLSSEDYPS